MNHRNSRRSLRRLLASTIIAVACLAVLPTTAPAQETRPKAPVASKTGKHTTVRNMMMLVVILGVGLGVHAIPSKRGHQD